jgi:hypothetical protein
MARLGPSMISKTLVVYTIWLGFDENDPYVQWTHYYLANIDKSSAYRVIRTFTNAKGEPLQGLVKLAGTSFLTPTESASLAGTSISSSNIQAVVEYALSNKLVDPAAPQNLYFVFSKSDNPAIISPLDVVESAGWHFSASKSSCVFDDYGEDDCGEPCTCTNTLLYTYSYVATPDNDAWVNYFANHDTSLSPSGDQKIDYFYDTVNHEVMETVTDANIGGGEVGWYTTGKPEAENGDLCNNVLLPAVQIPDNGRTFKEDQTSLIPKDVLLPTTSIASIKGGMRTVAYNTMVGGYPFILQAQYLAKTNPATGRQWGCVLGIDDNGVPIKDPRKKTP